MFNLDSTTLQTIRQANRILVAADTQSMPSNGVAAMALVSGLIRAGQQTDLVFNRSLNSDWLFLNGLPQAELSLASEDFIVSLDLSRTKVGQIKYKIEGDRLNFLIKPNGGQFNEDDVEIVVGRSAYDLVITVGVAELGDLGDIYNNNSGLFYQTPLINIDRQLHNENYGQINLVDLVASSNSEIIYDLYRALEWSIDPHQASGLLAGLIYDTRNFTNSRTTPQVLLAAANLIKKGARRDEIVNQWYATVKLDTLRLWGQILSNLEQSDNGLVWSRLEGQGETDSLIIGQAIDRLLMGLNNAKLIVVFCEVSSSKEPTVSLSLLKDQESLKAVNQSLAQVSDQTKVVVYSSGPINVQEWLAEFDPVIEDQLVSFNNNLSVASTMELILPVLDRRLSEID